MNILKHSSCKRKIVVFIIFNLILQLWPLLKDILLPLIKPFSDIYYDILLAYPCSILYMLNSLVLSFAAFAEIKIAIAIPICFYIFELILIISLFIKKSRFKLIANIILGVLCVIDICICIYSIINQIHAIENIFEIILDLIFIFLISFDILKTYKKPIKASTEDTPS